MGGYRFKTHFSITFTDAWEAPPLAGSLRKTENPNKIRQLCDVLGTRIIV